MSLVGWFSTVADAPVVLFPFIHMEGEIDGVQMEFETAERPGVDGFGVYLTGRRGQPFTLQTRCDFASKAAAVAAYGTYLGRVGGLLRLYRYGVDQGSLHVQRCRQLRIVPAIGAVGGVNLAAGASGVILECSWSLRAG